MKVKATKTGYHLKLREVGDVFDLEPETLFSKNWMEIVSPPKKKSKKTKKKELF